jgi:hypothetical protein
MQSASEAHRGRQSIGPKFSPCWTQALPAQQSRSESQLSSTERQPWLHWEPSRSHEPLPFVSGTQQPVAQSELYSQYVVQAPSATPLNVTHDATPTPPQHSTLSVQRPPT